MTALLDVAARSSAILAIALVADRSLRRSSAALRHALLAGALFTAAAVGPLGSVLPAWTLTLPVAMSGASEGAELAGTESVGVVRPSGDLTARSGAGLRGSSSRSISHLVLAVWLVGVVVCLSRLLLSFARLHRLARRARPLDHPAWSSAARAAASAADVRRPIALLETDATHMLATWGVVRPRIFVPAHARDWPADRIHAILWHELTHVARCDWLVQCAADVVLAAYWYNPLAWLAVRRLRAESERACDDAVLRHGVPARDYATHLVEIARSCRVPFSSLDPALPVTGHTELHTRIQAMLTSRSHAHALSRRTVALLVLALVAVVVPLSAFRVAPEAPHPLAGVVYDPTGAVVPGAKLTLEGDGGRRLDAISDEAGRFEFTAIAPGRYVLEVALPGFRMLKQSLEIRREGDWERAIILQLGDVQETIIVRSARLPASQAVATPARVRVGGNVGPPRKLRHAQPVYPASMRAAGVEGSVALEAIIGRDGNVQSARVVSGLVHPDLAQAAIDAVRQWKFEPTTLNGTPVEVVMNVAMSFELEK